MSSYNPSAMEIGSGLGELEARVYEIVCEGGPQNVAEVSATLQAADRKLAYTTVMTVLTRLWEKGFLIRKKRSRAYVYEARDRYEVAAHLGEQAVRGLLDRWGEPALTAFIRNLTPEQRALVADLLAGTDSEQTLSNNNGAKT